MGKLIPGQDEKKSPPAPPWTSYKLLVRKKFDEKVKKIVAARAEKKELEESIKVLDEELQKMWLGLPEDLKSIQVEQIRVTLSHGTSPARVDARKLLSLGVEPAIVKEATVEGTSYSFIRTTVAKADAD